MSNSYTPYGLYPARLLCPWDAPGKNTEWVAMPFSRDLLDPGLEPVFPVAPALQADTFFFNAKPPGKSPATGRGEAYQKLILIIIPKRSDYRFFFFSHFYFLISNMHMYFYIKCTYAFFLLQQTFLKSEGNLIFQPLRWDS